MKEQRNLTLRIPVRVNRKQYNRLKKASDDTGASMGLIVRRLIEKADLHSVVAERPHNSRGVSL